jgi:hypothetical protein
MVDEMVDQKAESSVEMMVLMTADKMVVYLVESSVEMMAYS